MAESNDGTSDPEETANMVESVDTGPWNFDAMVDSLESLRKVPIPIVDKRQLTSGTTPTTLKVTKGLKSSHPTEPSTSEQLVFHDLSLRLKSTDVEGTLRISCDDASKYTLYPMSNGSCVAEVLDLPIRVAQILEPHPWKLPEASPLFTEYYALMNDLAESLQTDSGSSRHSMTVQKTHADDRKTTTLILSISSPMQMKMNSPSTLLELSMGGTPVGMLNVRFEWELDKESADAFVEFLWTLSALPDKTTIESSLQDWSRSRKNRHLQSHRLLQGVYSFLVCIQGEIDAYMENRREGSVEQEDDHAVQTSSEYSVQASDL